MKKNLITLSIVLVMVLNMVCTVGAATPKTYIPVLLYHHIVDYDDVKKESYGTTLTVDQFEDHISTLTEQGYTAISLSELNAYMKDGAKLPKKPCMIMFDDGYDSNYYYAYPILKKYNQKATIFITTGRIKDTVKMRSDRNTLVWMTWDQIKEVDSEGLVEIQNHGYVHQPASKLTLEEFTDSVVKGQRILESKLGERKVHAFAYPHGIKNADTDSFLVDRGFDMQFTTVPKSITKDTPMNALPRITIGYGKTGSDIIAMMQKYK